LAVFNVVTQRLSNRILQELLVDFQSFAIDSDNLRAIKVQRHYAYKDQDAGNQIEQRYTVGQAHGGFRELNGILP
jgi:hypothetical protein